MKKAVGISSRSWRRSRRRMAEDGQPRTAHRKIVIATVKGDVHRHRQNIVVVLGCNSYSRRSRRHGAVRSYPADEIDQRPT